MSKPVAVITGDVHFTVPTLELATEAVKTALEHAIKLNVPLVINGDTLDSKAIVRGECMNRLIELLQLYNDSEVLINTGNHDLINEKGTSHVLNFLKPYCTVIHSPVLVDRIGAYVIPYQTSSEALQSVLDGIPKGSTLIVHQGVQTAYLGHYTQDKTSLPKESFADFRVIASHYHRRQDIKCGRPRKGAVGLFSYVGNPYSLNFGEAQDGPKGYSVFMNDGTLEFHPLPLRRHLVVEATTDDSMYGLTANYNVGDLVWLKLSGPRARLDLIDKKELGMTIFGTADYKLDKIYTDAPQREKSKESYTDADLLDQLIDSREAANSEDLKALWRRVCD